MTTWSSSLIFTPVLSEPCWTRLVSFPTVLFKDLILTLLTLSPVVQKTVTGEPLYHRYDGLRRERLSSGSSPTSIRGFISPNKCPRVPLDGTLGSIFIDQTHQAHLDGSFSRDICSQVFSRCPSAQGRPSCPSGRKELSIRGAQSLDPSCLLHNVHWPQQSPPLH